MLDSVKHDRTLGLAPVFRPISKKNNRSSQKLDVRLEKNGESIRIVCFEPLGPEDQTVFFAILALCTNEDRGLILGVDPSSNEAKRLREDLFDGNNSARESIMVKATSTELLQMCGKSDGNENYKNLRKILLRLASVTLHISTKQEEYSVKLLASHLDKETRLIHIAVNNRSAAAILGNQYAFISMAEHVKLSYAPARILHGWLSSWLPQGTTRTITAKKLVPHIYPNYEGVQGDSKRTYRSYAKKAAMALNDLGWEVTAERRGKDGDKVLYTITRPKSPLSTLPAPSDA